MQKFNDFEYETYAPLLYKEVIKEKDEYKRLIAQMYSTNDDFDKEDWNRYKKSLIKLSAGTAAGEIACLLTNVICQNSLGQTLTSMGIYTGAAAVGFVADTIYHGAKYRKSFKELIENTYKTLQISLKNVIIAGQRPTYDEVHAMTESVRNGELEYKFSDMQECGKLNIDLLIIDEYTDSVYEDVDLPDVLYLYEKLIYIINMAYEGYEEDVIASYDVIKEYTAMRASDKTDKEIQDKFCKFATYIESQCVKNAKSR